MTVNYSFAYRENTWAPVNVIVQNEKRDFSGWVELRCYSGDEVQIPFYRVAAHCPKGSKKRFQLCCYLGNTTRLEVRLYDGNREVLDFPARLDINPIQKADFMGLVLDDESTGFGFLSNVVNPNKGSEDAEGDRRFYREAVPTAGLPLLAKYPQCYSPFDVIVLGNVDPNGVSERHRELLYDYVRSGGAVAVCTGEYAPKYHGSWVEDLLGTTVGAIESVNEQTLADAVFAEADRTGAKGFRDCIVAALTPTAPGVERLGATRTLATRRRIGSGYVYGIAIDADSHALQDCAGYQRLWREIVMRRGGGSPLNFQSAARFTAATLPRISGIVIHSRASVVTYLCLYFFLAIVVNWIVFNRLKRREWAWVVLVLCSIGFTTYAVVFGTTGRAQSSEVQRIETIHVPKGGGLATLHADIGLLDARSRTYAMDLGREYTLAAGLTNPNPDYWDPRTRGMGNERPFYLVQDDLPRVEGFRVGASEMRLLHVESDLPVPGGVDGQVEIQDGGVVKMDLTNNTGYVLRNAFVYIDGQMFSVKPEGNRFVGEARNYRVLDGIADSMYQPSNYGIQSRGNHASDLSVEQFRAQALTSFRNDFIAQILSKDQFSPYGYGGGSRFNAEAGPFLCAWVEGPCLSTVGARDKTQQTIGVTFLVADIDIVRNAQTAVWIDLPVYASASEINTNAYWRTDAPSLVYAVNCKDPLRVFIPFSSEILSRDPRDLLVETFIRSYHNHVLEFQPEGAPDTWGQAHQMKDAPKTVNPNQNGEKTLYRVENWTNYAKPITEEVRGEWEELVLGNRKHMEARQSALPPSMRRAEPDTGVTDVARMLVGVITLAPGQPPCPRGDAATANEVSITARVSVRPSDDRAGETLLWQ